MSKFLKWNLTDWQKGLLVAIFTAPITLIYQSLTSNPGNFNFGWKQIVGISIAGGLGFILQTFLTNSKGQLFTTEPQRNADGGIIGGGKFLGVFKRSL